MCHCWDTMVRAVGQQAVGQQAAAVGHRIPRPWEEASVNRVVGHMTATALAAYGSELIELRQMPLHRTLRDCRKLSERADRWVAATVAISERNEAL